MSVEDGSIDSTTHLYGWQDEPEQGLVLVKWRTEQSI